MLWLLIGTVFYAEHDFGRSYAKGFYYAVNVGYSIGFGVLKLRGSREDRNESYAFSVFYVLCGALAMLNSIMSIFQDALKIPSKKMWYSSFYGQQLIDPNRSWKEKLLRYALDRLDKFQPILVWLIYVSWGTAWSCGMFRWNFIEGLYFAVSSLSTGGLLGIPEDSDELCFFIVGCFCCTGIPFMGMALSSVTALLLEDSKQGGHHELEEIKTASYPDNSRGDGSTPHKRLSVKRKGTAYSRKEIEIYEKLLAVPRPRSATLSEIGGLLTGSQAQTFMSKESFVLINLIRRGAVDRVELKNVMDNFDFILKEQRDLVDADVDGERSCHISLAPPEKSVSYSDEVLDNSIAVDLTGNCSFATPSTSTRPPPS